MKALFVVTLSTLFIVLVAQNSSKCVAPTITTSGKGTASGTPDIASFNIQISTTSKTSLEAAQTTNRKMAQVNQILNSNNISSNNIQTSSLDISPQYDYSGSYPYPIIGQRASTSVSVKILNIDANGTSVGKLYDQLSNIDGVTINGLSFDIQNKTPLKTRARASAYQQAQASAAQFAVLGGYNLGSPQMISQELNESPIVPLFRQQNAANGLAMNALQSTTVTTGSFQVQISTSYTFSLL